MKFFNSSVRLLTKEDTIPVMQGKGAAEGVSDLVQLLLLIRTIFANCNPKLRCWWVNICKMHKAFVLSFSF